MLTDTSGAKSSRSFYGEPTFSALAAVSVRYGRALT